MKGYWKTQFNRQNRWHKDCRRKRDKLKKLIQNKYKHRDLESKYYRRILLTTTVTHRNITVTPITTNILTNKGSIRKTVFVFNDKMYDLYTLEYLGRNNFDPAYPKEIGTPVIISEFNEIIEKMDNPVLIDWVKRDIRYGVEMQNPKEYNAKRYRYKRKPFIKIANRRLRRKEKQFLHKYLYDQKRYGSYANPIQRTFCIEYET